MAKHIIPALMKGDVSAGESKSCESCRFFNRPTKATQWVPAEPGHCGALKGKPVDLTIMTPSEVEKSHQQHASNCVAFNSPQFQTKPRPQTIPVALPFYVEHTISTSDRIKCTDCSTCANFIPPASVENLGLFNSWGLCGARGEMLSPTDLAPIARDCSYREFGPAQSVKNTVQNTGLVLLPEYNIEKIRAIASSNIETKNLIPTGYNPETYTSPVSASQKAQGIKGWLKLFDPLGTGNYVELPVFDRQWFIDQGHAEEAAKIPSSSDDERPDLYFDHQNSAWKVAVAFMELDETPALEGAPGVGKTELGRYLAWLMQLPFERISITNTTELESLEGGFRFVGNETVFQEGRVTKSWSKPCLLLVDEPNVGQRDVWQFFRPLTDNSKQLVVDAFDGVPRHRNDYCFMMFAFNPAWDMKNDGTNELADADIRRLFHIEMAYPEPEVEKQIIRSHCELIGFTIPDELLQAIIEVGESIRALHDALPISWGPGQQIKVARMLRWFMPVEAYNQAAGNYLEPSMRELFLSEVATKFRNG